MATARPPRGSLTVADVLTLDVLEDAEVLAGHAGLGRTVSGVNIIEVPDVWQWLRGGELLLSAAYPWKDEPERLVQVLHKLSQARISAVGFKLGPYVGELPEVVLACANELGLPIIRLPVTLAYRSLFEPLYSRLLSDPPPAEPVHLADEALLRLGLDDQSIEKILGALALRLDRTVWLADLIDEALFTAPPGGVVLRQDLADTDLDTQELISDLRERQLHRRSVKVERPARIVMASGLVVSRRLQGIMLVEDPDPRIDEGDGESLGAAVEHTGELVSFLLLKRLSVLEGRRQASSLFFATLMSDALTNEEATERALTLGLRLTQPCVAIMAGYNGLGLDDDRLGELQHALDRVLSRTPRVVAVDAERGALHLLLQTSDDDVPGQLAAIAAALGQYAPGEATPVAAAGSLRLGLEGVRRSRAESELTFETARRLGRSGTLRFEGLGVERLLAQIPATPLSQGYVTSMLGPIQGDDELLRTLELYLKLGGNKSATAAAVPLHRSSLHYRLDKISRLLGMDLDDPDQCLELWLAIRLGRVLGHGL